MSAYVLGLVTIPVVILLTALAWVVLRWVLTTFAWFTVLVHRGGSSSRDLNKIAAAVNAADRAWYLARGRTFIAVVHGYDNTVFDEAFRVLCLDGPHRDLRLDEVINQ